MDDPQLVAKKFDDLISLAKNASTEYEKAAVFAAVEALAAKFDAEGEDFGTPAGSDPPR